MSGDPTLYDQIVEKLKNNRIIAIILLASAVVIGISQLFGAFSPILQFMAPSKTAPSQTRLQVSAFVEPFDFMSDKNQAARPLDPIERDEGKITEIADQLAKEIVNDVGASQTSFEVTLSIQDRILHASRSVRVSIIIQRSPMAQQARISHDLGNTDTLDLQALSGDPNLADPASHSIHLEFGAPTGGFERQPLDVFSQGGDFSLAQGQSEKSKVIRFSPRKIKILLDTFQAGEHLQSKVLDLGSALQRALGKYPNVEISSETLTSLESRRKEIRRMQPGMVKTESTNQSDVDYVISGTLTAN